MGDCRLLFYCTFRSITFLRSSAALPVELSTDPPEAHPPVMVGESPTKHTIKLFNLQTKIIFLNAVCEDLQVPIFSHGL